MFAFLIHFIEPPPSAPSHARVELRLVRPSIDKRQLPFIAPEQEATWSDEKPEPLIEALAPFEKLLIDPVYGFLEIGQRGQGPVYFALTRIDADNLQRTRIIIDANRDKNIDTESEIFTTQPAEHDGRTQVIFNNVAMPFLYEDGIALTHEFRIRIAHAKPGEDAAPFERLHLSTISWLEGSFTLQDQRFRMAFIDYNSDGRATRFDRWSIVPDAPDAAGKLLAEENLTRPFRPAFLDNQAYRLGDVAISATSATVRLADDRPDAPPQ